MRARAALIALLVLGIGLRLWVIISERPAFLGYPDARAYIATVKAPLFWNPYRPAGYPILLRILHAISPHLTVAIVVQHVLGIATAGLLYLALRPFVSRWEMALLPVAVVLLAGTQIYLEHSALSDAPYTFYVAAGILCAARAVDARGARALLLLLAAGIWVALATVTRSAGIFLLPVLMLCAATAQRAWWRRRALRALAPLAGAIIVLFPYLLAQHNQTGAWGLTRTTGEQLYARTATFADCRRFTPPGGTSPLCQKSSPSDRPNATWYMFDLASPGVRTFGRPGPGIPYDTNHAHYRWGGDGPLGRFARTAIVSQPLELVVTTLYGLVKYVAPHLGPKSMLEWDQATLIHELHNSSIEADAQRYVVVAYRDRPGYVRHGISALDAYATRARIEGPLTGILAALMLAGWFLARGRVRTAAALFGGFTACLALVPVALLFYSARYATPMYGALSCSAAIGLDQVAARFRARSSR